MKIDFVEKLTAGNYKIGSFDSFIDNTYELIAHNNNLTLKQTKKLIDSFPSFFRASIIDKEGNYLGYIALYDCDSSINTTSLRVELNKNIPLADRIIIIESYKSWIRSSLNFKKIENEIFITPNYREEKSSFIGTKPNIIMRNNMLVPGIEYKTYDYYDFYYSLPDLKLPFTIKSKDKVLGIIGLCNVNYHNRRANLCIYFDKKIGDDIMNFLTSSVIDDYIDYVHNSNIHNITLCIPGNDKSKLEIANNSKMNYYGYIPFGSINYYGKLDSKYMFQHVPNMDKKTDIFIPDNIEISESYFKTEKKVIDPLVNIGNGYKLVSPRIFDDMGINKDEIVNSHISALQNRDEFSIPLGEDKFIIQKGNGSYGVSRCLMNFSYILLDKNNNYAGYINILRNNANRNNAEIEIGIKPGLQGNGLGRKVLEEFYNQLFSIGYASVTSAVFSFNEPSLKLHEKVAKLDGIRVDSYYINDRLWDMSFYSKTNDLSELGFNKK